MSDICNLYPSPAYGKHMPSCTTSNAALITSSRTSGERTRNVRACGHVTGAAPAAGAPGLPASASRGPGERTRNAPGRWPCYRCCSCSWGSRVAGCRCSWLPASASRGPGERTRNAPGLWPCHRCSPCSRCSWLPATAGGDRGEPVSEPGTPRADGHVTGAAPAAGDPWLTAAAAGGDRGEAVSAPGTPRADGHVTGAAPAAGDPGLPAAHRGGRWPCHRCRPCSR